MHDHVGAKEERRGGKGGRGVARTEGGGSVSVAEDVVVHEFAELVKGKDVGWACRVAVINNVKLHFLRVIKDEGSKDPEKSKM